MKNKLAFTLLELTMVVAIAAAMLGMSVGIFKQFDQVTKQQQVRKQLIAIEEALVEYFKTNKRLPCPADPDVSSTTSGYNDAAVTNVSCTTSLPSQTCDTSKVTNNGNVYHGALPTGTLGFDESMHLDPWGRRFTYAVDKDFTCSNGGSVATILYSGSESISIKEPVSNGTITDSPFAVVSHGENTFGSYSNLGVLKSHPGTPDSDEQENSDGDSTFVHNDFPAKNITADANFDDHVIFMPMELLVFRASIENNDAITYPVADYGGNVLLKHRATLFDDSCLCDGTESWTPLELSPVLWLDGSDSSSVTLVSGKVSQWNDKSGNGHHAVQSSSSKRPTYDTAALNGLNLLYFDGSDDKLDQQTTTNVEYRDLYIVLDLQNNTGIRMIFGHYQNQDDSLRYVNGGMNTTPDVNDWHYGQTSNVYVNGTQTQTVPSGYHIIRTYRSNTNGFGSTFRYEVSSDFLNRRFKGDIAEIVVFTSILSTAKREKVEGYLAHKWGLSGSLPGGHTYKSSAPSGGTETNLSDSGKLYCIK